MKKHVCYEKLSEKKKREVDRKKRGTWFGVNPVTRMAENAKAYNRKKAQGWKNENPDLRFLLPFGMRGFIQV